MASDHHAKDLRRTSTLTAADTFHGSTFDDEEACGSSSADFVDNPTAPVSKKNRRRLLLAVPAVLIVVGVAVGLATRGGGGEAALPGAEAPAEVPAEPQAPLTDAASNNESATGLSIDRPPFAPEPQLSVGDAALLAALDVTAASASVPAPEPSGGGAIESPTAPLLVAVVTDEPTASPTPAPSAPPTLAPTTSEPTTAAPTTAEPTTAMPTPNPTKQPTNPPTDEPTITVPDLSAWAAFDWGTDTDSPTAAPSRKPTPNPTNRPTAEPTTAQPTTDSPTPSPTGPFFFGDEFDAYPDIGANGIHVSKGLSVQVIARTGRPVEFANGESGEDYLSRSDAAGIIPECPETPTDCGYAYVVNSEEGDGNGGVWALYFDKDDNLLDYRELLSKTTDNCGGGHTPWNTWISCEEWEDGQCWQIDPYNGGRAEETKLGGNGGRYESVACDNRNPNNPVFFTTHDHEFGALRRFVCDGNGWDCLHSDPAEEERFLRINGDGTFDWTTDEGEGNDSAFDYFPNTEGIQFHEGKLHFMAKYDLRMFVLDLDAMTYETEQTGKKFYGEGSFGDQPDQNMFGPSRKYMYFTEDGGDTYGVYARYRDGTYFTLFEAIKGGPTDETVGVALSPDNRVFYAGIQDHGVIVALTRDDGMPFE
ncbi:hypothetical protein ACHAXT_000143 [Thalassiosira profunda]